MKRLITIAAITLAVALTVTGRDRTTRRIKGVATALTPQATPDDTITAPALRLSGYDKPATATREAMHITNLTGRHLASVTLTLRYLDMEGRTLHTRDITLTCDIPACDTSLVTWPSWDTQRSFRYHLSRPSSPRRPATPYTIHATPLSATARPTTDTHQTAK